MASLQNLAVIAPMTFGVDTVENMTMATSVDDITISREVEEAVASVIATALGRFTIEGSGPYMHVARLSCLAMLKAWPGMETKGTPMFPALIRTIILPLPKENTND